jgi:hypothetical protein
VRNLVELLVAFQGGLRSMKTEQNWEQVTAEWPELHGEVFHNLFLA